MRFSESDRYAMLTNSHPELRHQAHDTRTDTQRFEDYQAELTAKRRDALWRQLRGRIRGTYDGNPPFQKHGLGYTLYSVKRVIDGPQHKPRSAWAEYGSVGLVLVLLGLLALLAMAVL